jgi:hypothetical protein
MTVTFLQIRPATEVNEIWASTRRREGTLVVEVETPSDTDVLSAQKGGLILASGDASVDAPAYVVHSSETRNLSRRGVAGWRVTVIDGEDRKDVLNTLAFTRARFLRTNRSTVADAVEYVSLPGSHAVVSVFVDSVEDALAAIASGARDLLLRDWGSERIGELRDSLVDHTLVERGPFPLDVEYDDAKAELEPGAFSAYLNQIDGSGRARPRMDWAPGKDVDVPQPEYRVSAAWTDEAWRYAPKAGVPDASGTIDPILERALAGTAPTVGEIETLFRAYGTDVEAIADAADILRKRVVGDDVTFVGREPTRGTPRAASAS